MTLPCADLESVIATKELDQRPNRTTDHQEENRVLLALTQALSRYPQDFFRHLVKAVQKLAATGSAGISLLNEKEGRFVWPAVAGGLEPFVGAGTPSDFGPCGTVLDRGAPVLFIHPERHFAYLMPITPPLEEVLLVPFYVLDKAVGTIWAVSHDAARRFCAEDRRLLESLSEFAASAYSTLSISGALKPFLEVQPASS